MLKMADDAPPPTKADEVRRLAVLPHGEGKATNGPANRPQQLTALKAEFDSLRSHLTCKICDRLLYQPYTISCGHTYCYTVGSTLCHLLEPDANMLQCLCTWFVNNKARKTCPDCRIIVKELPAPAYVVSEGTNQRDTAAY